MNRLLLLLAFGIYGFALPNEFYITERPVSIATTFDLSVGEEEIGVGQKELFALRTNFTLEGAELNGKARARLLKWGLVADVSNGKGEIVGQIEEDLWRLYYWPDYNLYDRNQKLVAIAHMEPLKMELTVVDPADETHRFALIERPLIAPFRDRWKVTILDPKAFEHSIDPLLLIFLAMYQTDAK